MRLTAAEVREGDLIDLHGDQYADPQRANGFEHAYSEVSYVERETAECVAIGFEGFDVVGFPIDHPLNVRRGDVPRTIYTTQRNAHGNMIVCRGEVLRNSYAIIYTGTYDECQAVKFFGRVQP